MAVSRKFTSSRAERGTPKIGAQTSRVSRSTMSSPDNGGADAVGLDVLQRGMSEARRTVEVVNFGGLHARPASRFAAAARRFQSRVFVSCRGVRVSADSLLNLLELQASRGDRLEIVAQGPDAEAAVAALCALTADGFGFDEEEPRP